MNTWVVSVFSYTGKVAVNIIHKRLCEQVLLSVLGEYLEEWNGCGSHGMFNFLKNLLIVLQSACAIL